MGLFDAFKKKKTAEPEIPASEKQYYQPDSYYTDKSYSGTQFERNVITFEERKKTCIPSRTGLYVAEILLLEYCSYGTYPNPKNGYPGFWWFAYGIKNVGAALKSLEERGYIRFDSAIDMMPKMTVAQLKETAAKLNISVSGNKPDIIAGILDNASEDDIEKAITDRKYGLTEKGEIELQENAYVPYMHKHKKKTVEGSMFGPEFNVWSINRILGSGSKENWENIVWEEEKKLDASRR